MRSHLIRAFIAGFVLQLIVVGVSPRELGIVFLMVMPLLWSFYTAALALEWGITDSKKWALLGGALIPSLFALIMLALFTVAPVSNRDDIFGTNLLIVIVGVLLAFVLPGLIGGGLGAGLNPKRFTLVFGAVGITVSLIVTAINLRQGSDVVIFFLVMIGMVMWFACCGVFLAYRRYMEVNRRQGFIEGVITAFIVSFCLSAFAALIILYDSHIETSVPFDFTGAVLQQGISIYLSVLCLNMFLGFVGSAFVAIFSFKSVKTKKGRPIDE